MVIDSGARAAAEWVESGTASAQVMRFQDHADKVKALAGIREMWVLLHAGAGEGPSTRARDSTRWDDWPDAIWMYNKDDDGVRYLSATGRGVDLEPTMLSFDRDTDHLAAVQTYSDKKEDVAAYAVIDLLAVEDRPMMREEIDKALGSKKRGGVGIALRRDWIEAESGKGPNGGNAKFYKLADAGRSAQSRHHKLGSDESA